MNYRDDVMTYFQPLCSVGPTPIIVGFEALSRKPGKDGQVISIFEDLEKINDNNERHLLEMQCLEDSCLFLSQLPENDKTVSINLHPLSLGRDDLLEMIEEVIGHYPDSTRDHISFEIIEDEFPPESVDQIMNNIEGLRQAGAHPAPGSCARDLLD